MGLMGQDIKALLAQIEALKLEAKAYNFDILSCLLDLAYKETLSQKGVSGSKSVPLSTTTIQ